MKQEIQNFKLTLCYDGRRYRGWQKQGNTDNTIQAKLEALLSRLLSQDIEIAGSGRTDAGVHAREQVCSFKAVTDMSTDEPLSPIRLYLPEDIGAVSLEMADLRFYARLSCREKTYVYRIWVSPLPNVFSRRYTFNHPEPLDIEAMKEASRFLLGKHDFTAFCSNRHMKRSAVRELKDISFIQSENELRISLTGNGFLYNIVRIIVGTLLEVGEGKRRADSVPNVLNSLKRELAGPTAPAQGLFLWHLQY